MYDAAAPACKCPRVTDGVEYGYILLKVARPHNTALRGRSDPDALQGPDPHDMFGCSVPFSLWVGCLFVATLSYYTTDYMRQGQDASEKRTERYVYDPTAGELLGLFGAPAVPSNHAST